MAEIEISDLGTIGLIKDQEGYYIAPEALTQAMNMRSVADGVERLGGQNTIFPGTNGLGPTWAPLSQCRFSLLRRFSGFGLRFNMLSVGTVQRTPLSEDRSLLRRLVNGMERFLGAFR